ncbi:lysophospholipid acyltransferase 5 [Cetorhinus maximus]
MAYFNFGYQMLHSVVCVLFQFLVLRLIGRTLTGIAATFLFQMVYLLAGYYYTATDQYDIKWTMPHCVLTLKLIGLSLDYYDGGKDKVRLLGPLNGVTGHDAWGGGGGMREDGKEFGK